MLCEKLTTGCLLLMVVLQAVEPKSHAKTTSEWIECYPGNTNIIIAAPHGGSEKPSSIPSRDAGCYISSTDSCIYSHTCGDKDSDECDVSTLKDSYTRETAIGIVDSYEAMYGVRPHLVINRLHRSRMDANREINEAAFQVEEAEQAWEVFNECIQTSRDAITGRGLYIDLHGQSHSEKWIELGYLISKSDLDSGNFDSEYTSIRNLAAENSGTSFGSIICGAESMGGMFQTKGYKSVPSPNHPGPDGGKYYTGGYNTKEQGSRDGGIIDAIQIELPRYLRYSSKCVTFCPDAAEIIHDFMEEYYSNM